MKIYVTKDDKKIENFTLVRLQHFEDDLKEIINNSCTDIIVNDIIDFLRYQYIEQVLSSLVTKLRTGGRIIITGMELGILCGSVLDESITPEQYSEIIMQRASTHYMSDVIDIISKLGLKLDVATIKGIEYEISATR